MAIDSGIKVTKGKQLYTRTRRRTFLQLCPTALFGLAVGIQRFPLRNRQTDSSDLAQAQLLPPTPSCPDQSSTPQQFEGPFYLCDSPERSSLLEPGISGARMVLTGQVLSANCTPLKNALVDFWQADEHGEYDIDGYRLRGHQFTDAEGRYQLETIVPGIYSGRTRHLHVKIQVPEQPFFSTQLFFPADPLNDRDRFFQPELVMSIEDGGLVRDTDLVQQATFNFVLAV